MPAFTYLWTRDEYDAHQAAGRPSFRAAGGNQLASRGVRAGGSLYIISFFEGTLRLLGRIVVARVCPSAEMARHAAEAGYGGEFDFTWAADWAIADGARSSPLFLDLVVPLSVIHTLRFDGGRPPAFRGAAPDPQTFRGVRRITDGTATLFDRLLSEHHGSLAST